MNDTPERWLPIPGYEGLYDVSDQGRVRSWAPWNSVPAPRVLKAWTNRDGYLCVVFVTKGKRAHRKLHTLVMLAFVGPRLVGQEVRHCDTDRLNVRLDNLTYGTHSENILDSVRFGTHNMAGKTHCKNGHPFNNANTRILSNGIYRACRECGRVAQARYRNKKLTAQKGMI